MLFGSFLPSGARDTESGRERQAEIGEDTDRERYTETGAETEKRNRDRQGERERERERASKQNGSL